jgi:hypothetical protein
LTAKESLLTLLVKWKSNQTKMTEFDQKLRLELVKYKAETKTPLYEIADTCDIARNSLYQFNAGNSSLNGKNTHSLMEYLGLSVELKTIEK